MITASGNETLTLLVRQLTHSGLCSLVLSKEDGEYLVMRIRVTQSVDPSLGVVPSDPRRVEVLEKIDVAGLDDVVRVVDQWECQYGDMAFVLLEVKDGRGRWRPLSAPKGASHVAHPVEFALM